MRHERVVLVTGETLTTVLPELGEQEGNLFSNIAPYVGAVHRSNGGSRCPAHRGAASGYHQGRNSFRHRRELRTEPSYG